MNRVSRRAWTVLVFAAALVLGLAVFSARYFRDGESWATFFGSPHIYEAGNPTAGIVVDREEELLLDASGEREYSDDPLLRRSVLHILGDRYGYVSAPLLGTYMDSLISYNPVEGLSDTINHRRTARLTLSGDVQRTAIELMDGKKGTAAVYNYRTGEILCAVSSPNYDPDNVPDLSGEDYEGVYVNRFFKSTYTPGSVFKVFTLSVALETVPGLSEKTFYCTGQTIIDGEIISCETAHGNQTLEQAFRNSCNCAFAEITNMVPRETMEHYAAQAGLTKAREIDGITAIKGNFSVSGAGDGSYAWSGAGQYTDLINPCTYLLFLGATANGGIAAKPYLMEEITGGSETFYSASTEYVSCGFSAKTADTLAGMMRDNVVLKYGTDLFPNVRVCAKSGTAETGEGRLPNSMFAGFVDDDDYPLAFIVVIEEGGYGISSAAPVAGRLLSACIDAMDSEG